MDDREQLIDLYHCMYGAMISKNRSELERIHDDGFVLIHMTGMHQSKQEYIDAIMNGTLNYYSEQTKKITVNVENDRAVMTGNSRVTAAVFGGGRHTWRLSLRFNAIKKEEHWCLTHCVASTW